MKRRIGLSVAVLALVLVNGLLFVKRGEADNIRTVCYTDTSHMGHCYEGCTGSCYLCNCAGAGCPTCGNEEEPVGP